MKALLAFIVTALFLGACSSTTSSPRPNDDQSATFRFDLPARANIEIVGWAPGSKPVHRMSLATGKHTVPIRLGAGDYRVVIAGLLPLQRFVRRIVIPPADGSGAVPIDIDNSPLIVQFTGPDGGAAFEIHHSEGRWKAEVAIPDRRPHTFDVWQQGTLVAFVRLPGFSSPFVTQKKLEGPGVTEWQVQPHGATVHGTIQSESDGKPVGNATVQLIVTEDNGRRPLSTQSSGMGRYSFEFVPAGKHKVRVTSGRHPDYESEILVEDSRDVPLSISLGQAVHQVLRIKDAAGQPVEAVVFDGKREWALGSTDKVGEISLPLDGRPQTLFVVGLRKSFAVVSLVPSSTAVDVSLRAPDANIYLATRTDAGEPLPNIGFSVRYQGHHLPTHVVRALDRLQGIRFATSASGTGFLAGLPAGHYELWPSYAAADARRRPSGEFGPAPVQINAERGSTHVNLTFTPEP